MRLYKHYGLRAAPTKAFNGILFINQCLRW